MRRSAGWTLVEKFDDSRIRLKRPAGSKVTQGEFNDTYGPYRTTIGVSQGEFVMMVAGPPGESLRDDSRLWGKTAEGSTSRPGRADR